MASTINLPTGTHDDVLRGPSWDVIEKWNGVVAQVDEQLLQHYADRKDELLPTFAYAHVAKAAYSLALEVECGGDGFDPDEFGRRCASIAREQLLRCKQNRPDPFLPEGE